MILVVAATEMELLPLFVKTGQSGDHWSSLVCGAGPVESAVRLGGYLAEAEERIDCVCNLGVGGAYIPSVQEKPVDLLSVCLAEREVLGDYGICHGSEVELLPDSFSGPISFDLRSPYLDKTKKILQHHCIPFHTGSFVTVNASSGTLARGRFLQQAWDGLCENMEGAALARVCLEYRVSFLEVRVVSNLVEDRDPAKWVLQEACEHLSEVGALLLQELV